MAPGEIKCAENDRLGGFSLPDDECKNNLQVKELQLLIDFTFSLKLEEFLLKSHEIMQRFAIAWQVVSEGDANFSVEFQGIDVFHRLVIAIILKLIKCK